MKSNQLDRFNSFKYIDIINYLSIFNYICRFFFFFFFFLFSSLTNLPSRTFMSIMSVG